MSRQESERERAVRLHCKLTDGRGAYDPDAITTALVAIIESGMQAPSDFCGEQREWHLPRIQKAMMFLMDAFPALAVEAMQVAKDPYGDLLMKEDGDE